jgi:hypothetical protein
MGNFLISLEPVSFPSWTLFHGASRECVTRHRLFQHKLFVLTSFLIHSNIVTAVYIFMQSRFIVLWYRYVAEPILLQIARLGTRSPLVLLALRSLTSSPQRNIRGDGRSLVTCDLRMTSQNFINAFAHICTSPVLNPAYSKCTFCTALVFPTN